tara:strand:- start:303 stop:1274 length:972 start_codon:yes stop_codon:yes gene_type:complete
MQKVTGIKSVDFKVHAIGNGVVNWNGQAELTIEIGKNAGKTSKNHMLPKLRGYTNKTGKIKEENGYEFKKSATEIDFNKNPLYISQNCIRHHLFKDQSHDFHFAKKENQKMLLMSISGLLRGYVIADNQCKRKSPLLIEDFVDQLGNGNFEQFGNSGTKDPNSFYSKTTFGKTEYISYGSISIEDLQFISLDKKFDRESLPIKNKKEAEELAKEIENFIQSLTLNEEYNIKAEYGSYSRIGSIFEEPEEGILLNQDAIKVLVNIMIEMIEELSIKQAKGWMSVDNIELDYNDSNKMMRIIKSPDEVNEHCEEEFAIYYKKVGK